MEFSSSTSFFSTSKLWDVENTWELTGWDPIEFKDIEVPDKLYHISFSKIKDGVLRPRIPSEPAKYEDQEVDRVCFSDSIVRCLAAIGDAGDKVSAADMDEGENFYQAYLYILDTSQIDREYLVSPKELRIRNKVYDTQLTHEWWVLKPVKCRMKVLNIYNWAEEWCYNASFGYKEAIIKILKMNKGYKAFIEDNLDFVRSMSSYELLNEHSDFYKKYFKEVREGKYEEDYEFDTEDLDYELTENNISDYSLRLLSVQYFIGNSKHKFRETIYPGAKQDLVKEEIDEFN